MELEKKPSVPVERGWAFSFSLARTEGEDVGETVSSWRSRLSALDLSLIGAGLVLFLLEPFAIYMLLTHYKGPLLAETCAPSGDVVVVHHPVDGPVEHAARSAPGHEPGGRGDVITPLNARDPSNLVMTPYAPSSIEYHGLSERIKELEAELAVSAAPKSSDEDWKKVLREAARRGAAVSPPPKPASFDEAGN